MIKLKPNHFWQDTKVDKVIRTDGKEYSVRANRSRFFFPDEWMAFYDGLEKADLYYTRQEITFNVLLNTGARINEARHIKVEDIDLDRRNIILRVTKKVVKGRGRHWGNQFVERTEPEKGIARPRIIQISDKFAKFLKQVIKDYHLNSQDYLPLLKTAGANQTMKRVLKKVGIPDWQMFSVHNIRKTAEMWLLSLGVDSFKVVKRFGHSREVALQHYLSSDIFTFEEKQEIREIVGSIYEDR